MNKKLLLILLLVTMPMLTFGQAASSYCFSATSGTYADLIGAADIPGLTTTDDDKISTAVTLPFSFVFGGTGYTQAIISSNGWLSFGSATDSYFVNSLANAGNSKPVLFPLWDDLQNSVIPKYIVTGTAPNRVFKVEWSKQKWDYTSTSDVISFQIWLYETTNVIDYIYKRENENPKNASASIGIYDANGSYLTLNGSGGNPTAQPDVFTTDIDKKPANGQIYRFTPPPPVPTPTTSVGSYTFCIDNSNTITTAVVNGGQYAVLDVIKGFSYTFSVNNVFTGNENITVLDDTTNGNVTPAAAVSGTSGASISWTASISGRVKILLSSSNCNNGATGGALTLVLNSIGNTQDSQTSAGNDTWRGHLYNWTGSPAPGGASPSAPSATDPFSNAQYAGYYDVATEAINEGFGGNYNCFNVLSNGTQRASIYTERFAVRYRMKSTRAAGCYVLNIQGDDGVRLYIDGVKVFDEWKEQSPTTYGSLLVYLNGNSDLILDYYENGGQNQVSFSITPFNITSNTITAPSPSTVCSGVTPGAINGSAYTYNGSPVNPTIKFQWQISNDNIAFGDITGATLEDYTPSAITTGVVNVKYYRRVVSAVAATAGSCSYNSNSISITTSPVGAPAVPAAAAGTGATCSQITANWGVATNATSYFLDVSTVNTFASFVPGYNNLIVGNVTTYNVTGLAANTSYFYRVRSYNGCGPSTSASSGIITYGTLTTAAATPATPGVISGTTTQCPSTTGEVYSIASVAKATTYTWTVPTGWLITAGAGTTAITVNTGTSGQNGNITVTAGNSCGTSTAQTLAVTSALSAGGTVTRSGVSSHCIAANSTTFNLTGHTGSVVRWESSTDNFVSAPTSIANTTTSLTATNLTITTYYRAVVQSGSCPTANSTSDYIATGASVATAGTSVNCSGFTANWNKVAGATTYLLDVSTNGFSSFVTGYNSKDVGDVATFVVTGLLPNTSYEYRVWAVFSCGIYAVTSNQIPVTTSVNSTSITSESTTTQTKCLGAAFAPISVTAVGATGYQWYSNTTASTVGGTSLLAANGAQTNSYTPQSTVAGTLYYYCIVTGTCGAVTSTVSGAFVVNALPVVSFTAQPGASVCIGVDVTYTTQVAMSSYVWGFPGVLNTDYSITSGGTAASNTVTLKYLTAGSKTVTINYINGNSCTATAVTSSSATTVNALPATPTASATAQPTCVVSTGTITVTAPTGAGISYSIDSSDYSDTSGVFPGLAVGPYTVTAKNGSGCVSLGTPVSINALITNTWDGTKWSKTGDTTPPTATDIVVFNGPFTITTQLNACSCQINSGVNVVVGVPVEDPSYLPSKNDTAILKIENGLEVVSPGTLTFENNASLVQVNNDAVNTGVIVYRRNAKPMKNFDYTYWSSPVVGQTLVALSPNTLWDKYFSYVNNKWKIEANGVTPMDFGKGYIIRVPKPNFWLDPTAATYAQPVQFIGVPNNGAKSLAIGTTDGDGNLIGNPYPSAMSADDFLAENNKEIDGTIFFWTHNTAVTNLVYSSTDYASYNGVGGVGTAPAPSGSTGGANNNTPDGNIAAGQSFFTVTKRGLGFTGAVTFNNGMRVGVDNSNAQFFKGTNSKKVAIVKHRVWLNLANDKGAFKQTLVGYVTGATLGNDTAFDGESFDGNKYIDFYSINDSKNLVIQGRALPFDKTDKVPLGYKTTVEGTFAISIDKVDGVLTSQTVFVEDKVTNVIHNLKNGAYSFSTLKGVFNDRFVLRYTDNSVVVVDPIVTDPIVTDPIVTDPIVTTPVVTDPIVTTPVVTDPVVTDPVVTTPVVTDPIVTNPIVTIPVVTDPVITDPIVTTPVVTDPIVLDPNIGGGATLGTDGFDTKGRSVIVSVKDHQIKINSFDETIGTVMVYDLRGRLLYQNEHVNRNEFVIYNLNSSDQFLIVLTQLINGKWITKEIVF